MSGDLEKSLQEENAELKRKLNEAYRHLSAVGWFFDGRHRGRSPSQHALTYWASLASSDPYISVQWLENFNEAHDRGGP